MRRILAIILALSCLLSSLPIAAYAENGMNAGEIIQPAATEDSVSAREDSAEAEIEAPAGEVEAIHAAIEAAALTADVLEPTEEAQTTSVPEPSVQEGNGIAAEGETSEATEAAADPEEAIPETTETAGNPSDEPSMIPDAEPEASPAPGNETGSDMEASANAEVPVNTEAPADAEAPADVEVPADTETSDDTEAEQLPEDVPANENEAVPEGETMPEEDVMESGSADPLPELDEAAAAVNEDQSPVLVVPDGIYIAVGETARIPAEIQPASGEAISFATGDTAIITLTRSGAVYGRQSGVAAVQVSTESGLRAFCSVVVLPAEAEETIDYDDVTLPKYVELYIGDTHQLTPEIKPPEANSPLVYTSTAPGVARVDESGLITAVGKGTAYIEVAFKSRSGVLTWRSVTVRVLLNPEEYEHDFTIEDGVLTAYSGDGGDIVVPDGVKKIAPRVFGGSYYSAITSMTLPDSVTELSEYAFAGLEWLRAVRLPAGLKEIPASAFDGCTRLEISLPDGLLSIGDRAFADCSFLVLPSIPDSVKSIGADAFYWCSNLGLAGLPAGLESLGERAFQFAGIRACIVPAGLREIPERAFYQSGVLRVVIPGTVESIGAGAFQNCSHVTEIIVEDGVKTVGEAAFVSCGNLRSLTLPASIESIPYSALTNLPKCTATVPKDCPAWLACWNAGIKIAGFDQEFEHFEVSNGYLNKYTGPGGHVTVPEGVLNIRKSAFQGYEESLTALTLPDSLLRIEDSSFNGFTALESIDFGGGALEMGEDCFNGCTSLGKLTIPGNIRIIPLRAFYKCSALTELSIEDGVEQIGYAAFGGTGLVRVHVPGSVKSVGGNAFSTIPTLEEAVFSEGVESLGRTIFYSCDNMRRVVLPASITYIDTHFSTVDNGIIHAEVVEGSYAHSFCKEKSIPFSIIGRTDDYTIEDGVLLGYSGSAESFTIPEEVHTIGRNAFVGNQSLRSVTIPATVKSILYCAFSGCRALEEVHFSEGLTLMENATFNECSSLKAISLPDSLTIMGRGCFSGCDSLKQIRIGTGITSLQASSFQGCTGLVSIAIPDHITSIGEYCFQGCSALKDAWVPASVKKLGTMAFTGNGLLTIRGEKRSAVETFCKNFKIPFTTSASNSAMIAFSQAEMLMGVGQSILLPLEAEAGLGSASFKSSSTSCVTVDASGVATAKKTGTVTITATAGGLKATMKLIVKAAPKAITLDKQSLMLMPGENAQLNWTLTKNSVGSVSFSSDAPAVANVDENGLVTAAGVGSAEITAKTHNGKTAAVTVTVFELPSAVYLDRSEIALRHTLTDKLIPAVNEGAYCSSYGFASSDSEVVTVGEDGLITGVGRGTAIITVTTPNGLSAECRVTVIAPPPKIQFEQEEIILGLKDSRMVVPVYISEDTVYNGAYSFASKNTKVASVDASGVVTAKKTGSTIITASTEDGLSAQYKLTVKAAPKSISIDQSDSILIIGESMQLSCSMTANSAASVSFASDNPAAATVSADGVVTAHAAGSAKISAEAHNGRTASITVTVYELPSAVYLSDTEITLRQTMAELLRPYVNEGAYCADYSFSSSDPDVVFVTKNGTIRGEGRGTAVITVTTSNGLSTECRVTVIAPPPRIQFAQNEIVLGLKDSAQIIAEYVSEDTVYNGAFSFASRNASVASVDASGRVTAKKVGSTAITVSTDTGVYADCRIVVKAAPKKIEMADSFSLAVGEELRIDYTLTNNSASTVSFTSSDPSILEVRGDGSLLPKTAGEVTVTARTHNGRTAKTRVTVYNAPTTLRFADADENGLIRLGMGMEGYFRFEMGENEGGRVIVESSEPKVLAIDPATGKFRTRKTAYVGFAVTATTYNGISASCRVVVEYAPDDLEFTPESLIMGVGDVAAPSLYCDNSDLTGLNKRFRSSNPKVVAVDENGVLTAKKAGKAVITANIYNGVTAECSVTVKAKAKSMELPVNQLSLGVGESYSIAPVFSPKSSAAYVTYTSSNPDKLSVDINGKLYAKATSGSCTVTATTSTGLTASCEVTLNPAPTALRFYQEKLTLPLGAKYPLMVYPEGGDCASLSIYIEGSNIVDLKDGMLVARKKGSAVVEARCYNGKKARMYVTVEAAPKKYNLSLPSSLNVGYMYSITEYFSTTPAFDPYAMIQSVSVNNKCAEIIDTGMGYLLVPLEKGSFTLTIKTINGKSVKKSLKAVEASLPELPAITSPLRTDAEFADFAGNWKIHCISSYGVFLSPEAFSLHNTSLNVSGSSAQFSFMGVTSKLKAVEVDSVLILSEAAGGMMFAGLHENGMLSLPVSEELTLWFSK